MLSILLAILKFIGILLLSILLLLILIITIVLISPLKYHLAGEKMEGIQGNLSMHWLFGLIRAKGSYTPGKEPEIIVKILWFPLFGKKKEKKKARKRKPKPVPQKMGSTNTVSVREKAPTTKKQPSDGIYMAESKPSKKETAIQPTPSTEEVPPIVSASTEPPLPPKPKVRRVKVSDIQESPPETLPLDEPEDFFTGEPNEETEETKLDKLRFYWNKFQETENKRELFLAAKKLLKRLIKGILPNHLFLKATVGLGDPTYTGYLMGLVGILTAKFGRNIQVKGDFTRLVAEDIQIKVTGKIVIGYFIHSLLAFALAKPVRRILIKLWKGRKQNG